MCLVLTENSTILHQCQLKYGWLSALNTPKSLGVPTARSRRWRSGDCVGEFASLHVISTFHRKVWFSCLTLRVHLRDFGVFVPGSDLEVLQQSVWNTCGEIVRNQESVKGYALLWEELKVVLTRMATTQSIWCRDNAKIARVSTGIGFWTYVDWDIFANLR